MAARDQLKALIQLGPFKGVDTTSAGPRVGKGYAQSAPGANPHRVPGALAAERGRINLTTLTKGPTGAVGTCIVPYNQNYTDEQIVAVIQNPTTTGREMFDPAAATETTLNYGAGADTTAFNQAVQFGQVLYDNAGRQYSSLNPANTYDWHYAAPPAGFTATAAGAGALAVATYSYAFTRVVKDANNAFSQETSPYGSNFVAGVFPVQATPGGATGITLAIGTSTFSGTNTDLSTYTTNVYRTSTLNGGIWYFLINLTTNVNYIDNATDASLTANATLVPNRDIPPVSATNLGAIFQHKERMWNFVVTQNALTNNQPQSQMWFSTLGRPWEFNNTSATTGGGVFLVGNSATHAGSPVTYTGSYGDYPVAGISFGSVALAWKSRTTWEIVGDDPSTFRPIKIFDVGCDARQSVVLGKLGNAPVVFWLSEEGPSMTDGSSYSYIGEGIRSFLDTLSDQERQAAVGMYARRTYLLSFPTRGITWAYYTMTNDWYGPLPYATSSAFSLPANPSIFSASGVFPGHNEITAVRAGTMAIDQWLADSTDHDLNISQLVTWTDNLTDCSDADPRGEYAEKLFNVVNINAPVQPGIMATVTLLVWILGDATPHSFSWTFDLGKGPIQTATIPNSGLRGMHAQLSVSYTTAA